MEIANAAMIAQLQESISLKTAQLHSAEDQLATLQRRLCHLQEGYTKACSAHQRFSDVVSRERSRSDAIAQKKVNIAVSHGSLMRSLLLDMRFSHANGSFNSMCKTINQYIDEVESQVRATSTSIQCLSSEISYLCFSLQPL